jgi:cysteine desulfurase/selenocysteine lyase
LLVDAAQSAPHQPLNVAELEADFLVFSGHKMLGPTGVGVLYIKQELHDVMVPYRFGGGMTHAVCLERSTWAQAPHKFEAGTQPIAQALGCVEAIKYLTERLDFASLRAYEASLIARAIDGLSQFEQVRILGPIEQLKQTGHLVSCVIDGIHPHDVAAFLDQQDVAVAVRAGQQCAQPLHTALVIPASIRVSVYLYTTADDIDLFIGYIARLLTK